MTDKNNSCEYIKVCPFFQETLSDMPATVHLVKSRYCHSVFKNCARYRVTEAVGAEHVSHSLFPKNNEEADKIITRIQG